MNIIKTLSAGTMGISAMTLFSYAVSQKRRKQFEEPVLLHKIVKRGLFSGIKKRDKGVSRLDGWLLHYAAGIFFSTIYDRIWKETKLKPALSTGMVLGAISGLAGIGIWDIILRIHPDPPELDKKEYYRHLMAAHVIFGVSAALGYRAPEAAENVD